MHRKEAEHEHEEQWQYCIQLRIYVFKRILSTNINFYFNSVFFVFFSEFVKSVSDVHFLSILLTPRPERFSYKHEKVFLHDVIADLTITSIAKTLYFKTTTLRGLQSPYTLTWEVLLNTLLFINFFSTHHAHKMHIATDLYRKMFLWLLHSRNIKFTRRKTGAFCLLVRSNEIERVAVGWTTPAHDYQHI